MAGIPGAVPLDLLLSVLLASVRAVAWLLLAPPFANSAVTGRTKAMLAVGLSIPMAQRLREQVPAAEPGPLITALVQQAVVGAVLGGLCALVFAAVQTAGDLLDLFGGFQLASAYDPLMQTQTAIFGKLYGWTSTALLLYSGGYLLILQGFLRTYDVLPLNAGLSVSAIARVFTTDVGQMMLSALQIAGPLVAVLFVTDIGLGLLSRVAPALNVFAMSFPLKILVALTLGGFGFALLPGVLEEAVDTVRQHVVALAQAGLGTGAGTGPGTGSGG